MIIKNLGWKQGLGIVAKQMITATICLCITVLIMNFWRDLIDIIDQDIKQFISEGQVSVTPYREQL